MGIKKLPARPSKPSRGRDWGMPKDAPMPSQAARKQMMGDKAPMKAMAKGGTVRKKK